MHDPHSPEIIILNSPVYFLLASFFYVRIVLRHKPELYYVLCLWNCTYFVCMEIILFYSVLLLYSMLFCITSMANQFIPKFSSCLQWIRQYTVLGTGYLEHRVTRHQVQEYCSCYLTRDILIIYT